MSGGTLLAREPSDVIACFARAVTERDLDLIVSLYEPGAVYIKHDRSIISGDEIRSFFSTFLEQEPQMSGRMVDGWVTDRLALVHNEWHATTRRSEFSGVSEVVLARRAGGGWGVVIDHSYARPSATGGPHVRR